TCLTSVVGGGSWGFQHIVLCDSMRYRTDAPILRMVSLQFAVVTPDFLHRWSGRFRRPLRLQVIRAGRTVSPSAREAPHTVSTETRLSHPIGMAPSGVSRTAEFTRSVTGSCQTVPPGAVPPAGRRR